MLIDCVFPGIDRHNVTETARFKVPSDFMPQIAAIVEAAASIPDERLPTDHNARFELFAIITAIRTVVSAWIAGRSKRLYLEYLPGISDRHPLDALRSALLRCRDDCASSSVVSTIHLARADTLNSERRCSRADRCRSQHNIRRPL